jgi:cytoskeletal protein RodZ
MEERHSEPVGRSPSDVGARLAEARRSQKLSLDDIAARSRVPLRHLEAIERGDHTALPAATYSVGFVRTYAQLLGLDSAALARDFRAEIGARSTDHYAYEPFEPADPTRVPSRLLAYVAVAIAVLLFAGYAVWRGGLLSGEGPEERATLAAGLEGQPARPAALPRTAARTAAPAPASRVVLLTATQPVWLRVYEKDGELLLEKEMAVGESWQLPETAKDPRILTGRPQALHISVGGTTIPPLGPAERTVKDVSLAPAALLARLPGAAPVPASPSAAGSPVPAAGVTPAAPAPATPPTPAPSPAGAVSPTTE